jgi:magnesium chelatase family protein
VVSKVISATVIGLEAKIVHVEVHFAKGQSKFFIVGLPDKACSESKERVTAIIKNFLGHRLPAGTFTVNLAPADILKSGPVYDLPIAIGILNSLGEINFKPQKKLLIGELSLDGRTRHTNAILPIVDLARKKGIEEVFLPKANACEASIIPGVKILPVRNLDDIVEHIQSREQIKTISKTSQVENLIQDTSVDISLIRGQKQAKRALEIAAAGGHNLLMSGSPGSGKTMLAKTLPTILPAPTLNESLEITKVYSVAGLLTKDKGLITTRPFRKPHHTISNVALVGGGTIPRPGEISLAHRGVLFLDEFTEFSNQALEALRQPLEDGVVTISRAKGTLTFPASLMLVAAMNPCKCGWYGDEKNECTCTPTEIIRYKKRISGPILDRIDLQINVRRVEYDKLRSKQKNENSEIFRKRILKAKKIQLERYKNSGIIANSEMSQADIEKFIKLDNDCESLLKKAMNTLFFSARSYFRLLKIARTIADLEASEKIKTHHIAEAISFRIAK